MKNLSIARWLWAWIVTAVLVTTMLQLASPARATQEWHLALNGVSTPSGNTCGGSILNPWDGTGDYLLGSYYDTGNSGLTFKYSYNGGSDWVTPGAGSGFGDDASPPYYFYWFGGNGPDGSYQIPTWQYSVGATFIIRPIGGSGAIDFTCAIP